jgi:hypothetical protein
MQSPPPLVPSLMESVTILDDCVNFGYENGDNGPEFIHANTATGIFPRGRCLQPRDITVPLWNTLSLCTDTVANHDCNVHEKNNCDFAAELSTTKNDINPNARASTSASSTSPVDATNGINTTSRTKTVHDHDNSRKLHILSLPLDSLHMVASFLEVKEWKTFGIASREASLACRDVFRKVKMHAFHCAVEVVTACVSDICRF